MSLAVRIRRRLRALGGRPEHAAPPPHDPDLDLAFYRAEHPDLTALDDDTLRHHYAAYGRAEGRRGNPGVYLAALEAEHGPLPPDFDPDLYLAANLDLAPGLPHSWHVAAHYLQVGRREKRPAAPFDAELYRQLYFPDTVITDYELRLDYERRGRAEGLTPSWALLLRPDGLGSAWVELLRLDEFELLNWDWAGPTPTRLDAVRRMLGEGIARLAPISFDLAFDPAYYRETHPELAGDDDAQLYRDWLGRGCGRGESPSAERALAKLGLPLRSFPESFDWRGYALRAGLAGADRWTALVALMRDGLRPGDPLPAAGEGAADFLSALGSAMRGRDEPLSRRALEAAWAAGARDPVTAQHLGDALLRAKRPEAAVPLYLHAAAQPAAELWSFVNGAKAAALAGCFRTAFDLLRRSKAAYGGEPPWRDAVREAIEAWFSARTRRARQFYGLGARERADDHIARLIGRVEALWAEFDPIGAPLPATADGRVVMLANDDIAVCTHYRIDQKEELFAHLGRPFEVYTMEEVDAFISALPGATAAIFFRLSAWPSVVRAMAAARAMGVPTYYEMDDLTFDPKEFPDTLESYGGLMKPATYETLLFGVPLARAAIAMCDYGIASTTPLARAMQPVVRTGEVFWLPNGLDSRNQPWLDAPPGRVRRNDHVVIAYASGTTAHNSDFHELATPAIIDILKANKNVRFLLVGFLALTPAYDEVRDQVIRLDYVDGSQAFWSLLADADINIAVLKSTWATDSKSEIKWLEAAVMGIPSVVSRTAMYEEVIEDGVDGLIARTPDDWRRHLGALVADADLRRRIGEGARRTAARRYTVEANARRVDALLLPAVELRTPRPLPPREARRTRVLLANVWFPPQTIGGATRVLRNNLDSWLDAGAGEAFEFLVVTTDNGVAPPYRRRVDSYRGVPVVRIATPMKPNMDWRPTDPEVGALFADLLDSWRPDLVHFHAVQRLTASVVEEARLAGVPYLVTPHDAWWLSDWHFLTDDDGRPHAPCEDLPRHPPKGVSVSQSLDRRRVLARALAGAERVLPVSESFAALHRACGVERVQALPNGTPPLPPVARVPGTSGRVRLAHVGNVAKHKGFHLLQAVLRRATFANLELVVIDHARSAGSELRTTWGATPVRIVGKRPQERIHELYAETDVLVAPSTWPESYGLVAREALQCGCWVVAGTMGAMGEDVTPGENGFVVDVSTPDGLAQALAAIDADPARYTTPPAHRPALRTADDQARELLGVYREVVARVAPPLSVADRTAGHGRADPPRVGAPSRRKARGSALG